MTQSCHSLDKKNQHIGCVSQVPIFNHLAPDQMREIMQVVHSLSFKKGEMIYHAGDSSHSLYIVNAGQVKIYYLSEDGKEQMIRILKHGDFTGELALFQKSVHEAYAEALVDTQVCMINGDELEKFLLKYPTIAIKILSEFSSRLAHSEKQTTRLATARVEGRLAKYLLDLLKKDKTAGGRINLPMSKKDLASYLGTTPETLSRKLADLESAGYIEQTGQRKIRIIDAEALLEV